MSFRTLEISNPAEIHVKNKQLQVTQENGTVYVPIEDISHIFCIGPGIRLSTMALSIIAQSNIVVTTLDYKYLPTAIVTPYEGNVRQSQVIRAQISMEESKKELLWKLIIKRKIENQSKAVTLLGLQGAERISEFADTIDEINVNYHESLAAKMYFEHIFPRLNRRTENPINSRLNYGYSVIRSAIIRSLFAKGIHPIFGLHHNNQLNSFNLADDLIEPWRAMVDMAAFNLKSDNI